jgi:hypothetical protein
MSDKDTILVLTYKSIDTMIEQGGCGYWKANAQTLMSCKYLVATRNARSKQRQGEEPHGAAFMVAEVSGVFQATESSDRYVVALKRFARFKQAVPDVWTSGGSNPVHYESLADLDIDLRKLKWEPWPGQVAEYVDRPLTMAQAKKGLALTFAVDPDQIEIIVKG